MLADIMVDVPSDTSAETIAIIEAGTKRNALTIYNFVKSAQVTVLHEDEFGSNFSETVNVQ